MVAAIHAPICGKYGAKLFSADEKFLGEPHERRALTGGTQSPADQVGSPDEESGGHPGGLLRQWQRGLHISHVAHTRAAVHYDRRARGLGVTTTVASTVVGTSLFASIAGSADIPLIAFAAVLSVVAAVSSALQTSLNYGELASRHRAAATDYGDLRRQAEELIEFGAEADLRASMAKIRQSWNQLEGDSPPVPQKTFDAARVWVMGATHEAR